MLPKRTNPQRWLLFLLSACSIATPVAQSAIATPPQLIATSCLPKGNRASSTQGIVIERDQIEQQSRFNRDLRQILVNRVPGVSSHSLLFGNRVFLRGRPAAILIDGVPVTADADVLSSLDPDAVERIEVISGPSVLCRG